MIAIDVIIIQNLCKYAESIIKSRDETKFEIPSKFKQGGFELKEVR